MPKEIDKPWWLDLNDTWSNDKIVYLTSGEDVSPTDKDYYMGDMVFHRFFGSDDYDAKSVRSVLVEAHKWTQWNKWLEEHRTSNALIPLYVHPIDKVLISRRSFRITKWVDEYRPYDFFNDY